MKSIARSLSLIALGLVVSAPTFAANVNELETAGTAINNSVTTAQGINALDFTPNVNPNVFGNLPTATVLGAGGGDDVDFFSFQANAGTAYFDIDNDPFSLDTILNLFDSNGTWIGNDDDSFPTDPGTAFGFDSFIGVFNLPSAGTYYVTVTEFDNFPNQINNPNTTGNALTRPDNEFGGFEVFGADIGDSSFFTNGPQRDSAYTLHISLQNPGGTPVPEPGSIALLVGMASIGGMLLRRRK